MFSPMAALTAGHLPRSRKCNHAPAAIPGTVVVLGIDEVLHRLAHGRLFPIEIDVAKKLKRPRRQIAVRLDRESRVIRERHILEPVLRDFLVEPRPAAIGAIGNSIASGARWNTFAQPHPRSGRTRRSAISTIAVSSVSG